MLEVKGIYKKFGNHEVLKNFSLSVNPGDFISLLGPSGCGKTTALRIMAGLETVDKGEVFLDGTDITSVAANQRPFNMVFQKYALFPHLNVFENVAFGLRIKERPYAEINIQVLEYLSLVKMEGFAKRQVGSLSGGQQQRVGLVRALVNKPRVLLLDEPLSALDKNLRVDMQMELRQIQSQLKTAFIFVTHDQDEALNLSDRVLLMNQGEIVQEGHPETLYNSPANDFAASFFGINNCLDGELTRTGTSLKFKVSDMIQLELNESDLSQKIAEATPTKAKLYLRPENIALYKNVPSGKGNMIAAKVVRRICLGPQIQYVLKPQTESLPQLVAVVPNSKVYAHEKLEANDMAYISWDKENSYVHLEAP